MKLGDPIRLGDRDAPNRLLFGPHETNLARGRAISDRHVAYYARRAAGGAGVIVTEEASVHDSDWPYERSPLADECARGWHDVADAVHATDTATLVLAALGHSGGQGSSAYSQAPLFAPSRVPEVNAREVPKWMEDHDIEAVLDGFATAARTALRSGMDGVEINAGQNSLIRQFLSGLTNLRDDRWGSDRSLFAMEVLRRVRTAIDDASENDHRGIVGLRLSGDELAPWAGITADAAGELAVQLAPFVDYLVVVRGSIFTVSATRPDFHEAAGFNRDLCRGIRTALRDAALDVPVCLQGSVVDPAMADDALETGVCDLVEMTRAQIADAALGTKVFGGDADRVRPCVLCNQQCAVRDARNPIVSCAVDPSAGHEIDDPSPVPDRLDVSPDPSLRGGPGVLVVGGGPAGLEAARVASMLGGRVRVMESSKQLGSRLSFPVARSGNPNWSNLIDWLVRELEHFGVRPSVSSPVDAAMIHAATNEGEAVIVATGSVDGEPDWTVEGDASGAVISAADLVQRWSRHSGDAGVLLPGEDSPSDHPMTVVVADPIGGPIGVAVCEALVTRSATTVHLVTQDHLAGNELARSGDLAPANARLAQAGVNIERRSIMRSVDARGEHGGPMVLLENRFTGERYTIACDLVVDAGFRLPDETLWRESGGGFVRAGDCIAPRTVHEAMLEGRRAAVAVMQGTPR